MNKHVKSMGKSRFSVWRVLGMAFLLLLSLAGRYAAAASQQQRGMTITGTVVDEINEPIPGTNVTVRGTTNGNITDMDGNFILNDVAEGATLVISYVGYRSTEVKVEAGKTNYLIQLREDTQDLEEVVVVAYGTQKKVSVTGAVASVQTKELKQSSSANLTNALSGRLPGLTAIQTSGQPGYDNVQLFLRGQGTTTDASPLILIDGVPRDNISMLDPNEIASVSILKDASATAVFGVRGANGVILITTRRGEAGKTELSISANYSLQSFTSRADRVHSWEFAELRNRASLNDGGNPDALPYTQYMIDKYRQGGDPFYPDRDVFHEIFEDWSPQTRINANLTGGSDKMRYFANVAYTGQGGMFKTEPESKLGYDPGFHMNRYNFRANLDYDITKGLKMSLNIASYLEKVNMPQTASRFSDDMNALVSTIMAYSYWTPPTDVGPVTLDGYGVTPDQVVNQTGQDWSAWAAINRYGYSQRTKSNLNSSLALDWDLGFITKGLSTKFQVAYDNNANSTLEGWNAGFDTYGFSVAREEGGVNEYNAVRVNEDNTISLKRNSGSDYYMNLQYSIHYARQFGNHNLTGLALVQRDIQSKNYSYGDAFKRELPFNYLGLSSRITYDYDSRYLAEVNLGYNGSEQFAKDNRFGFFPAFSAGWVASNERFLKDNSVISNLKIRASYGEVGSDKLGDDRFLYISAITTTGTGPVSSLGKGNAVTQGKMGNEGLSWEIVKKQNYGIDIQLFNQLSLTADVFFERCDNRLISRNSIPTILGVSPGNLPKVNMGEVENKGYELELTWNKRFGSDLFFMVKGNFAYAKNTQNYMDEVRYGEDYAYRYRQTGFSRDQCFGYLIDYGNGNGYINTQEEMDHLPTYEIGTPRLGDFAYVDVNGDGLINVKDQVPVGYSEVPRITYGFSASVNWKDFDFSVLFSGIGQSTKQYTGLGATEFGLAGFYSGYHRNAWTQERYENGLKVEYPALGTIAGTSIQANEFFLMNRSFLRLKNIEIGYTLPKNTLRMLGINSVRVFLNGNNLLTWKNLKFDMIDPEQTSSQNYPITKMISGGINVTF
ncbi:MAG TPA: TonB-dependent receptor [Porphyromonadaceae bacterium]|nr:TonB-dependent receptor [Porphyromonadaceae bacterium]